jgi:hypothetical protein
VLPDDEVLVDPLLDDELLEQPAAVTAATATIASAGTSFRAFKSVSPCSLAYVRSVNQALHAGIAGHFLTLSHWPVKRRSRETPSARGDATSAAWPAALRLLEGVRRRHCRRPLSACLPRPALEFSAWVEA